MFRGFLVGVVVTLVVVAGGGILAARLGVFAPGADSVPGQLETWLALNTIHACIAREAASLKNPLSLTDENLKRGLDVYEQHCLICHGGPDGQASDISLGLNVPAPQFADEAVGPDAVARSFWVAKHGIRLSAMPAFAKTLDETQLWQVSMFVARIDRLPDEVNEAWKKLPSMAPQPVR